MARSDAFWGHIKSSAVAQAPRILSDSTPDWPPRAEKQLSDTIWWCTKYYEVAHALALFTISNSVWEEWERPTNTDGADLPSRGAPRPRGWSIPKYNYQSDSIPMRVLRDIDGSDSSLRRVREDQRIPPGLAKPVNSKSRNPSGSSGCYQVRQLVEALNKSPN